MENETEDNKLFEPALVKEALKQSFIKLIRVSCFAIL